MKIFYDTEFLEGTQKTWLGGKTKPTIDLISIAMVKENGEEYYAISKDFNIKEAWNRYDRLEQTPYEKFNGFKGRKVYWIRENVLMPIFFDLAERDFHNIYFKDEWIYEGKIVDLNVFKSNEKWTSDFAWFKKLINKYGLSNSQISNEIKKFCYSKSNIELYGYYSAYDHVALSWLFGKMIDLPKGFPMYTKDLKQILDEKQGERNKLKDMLQDSDLYEKYKESKMIYPLNLKEMEGYPTQKNKHDALHDARWNRDLYNFLTHGIHRR